MGRTFQRLKDLAVEVASLLVFLVWVYAQAANEIRQILVR